MPDNVDNTSEQVIYDSSLDTNYNENINAELDAGDDNLSNEEKLLMFTKDGVVRRDTFSIEDIIELKLQEPINPLDPYVYHDPPTPQPFIIKLKSTIGSEGQEIFNSDDINNSRIEGIQIPVVRLNTNVIDNSNIVALTITYTKFLPEITLIIKDPSGKFGLSIRPGLNNIIQVVIMPSIEGKYKKISLPFYITDVEMDIYGERVTYTGVLKHMPLIQQRLISESINYQKCDASVDPEEKCAQEDTDRPNMWELFHKIAERTELGFASMKGLKDYQDHAVRNVCSQSYKELLEYNLSVGGLDETMIYDGWVDLYGYLVLVDVYKALHDNVEANNLAMYAQTGLHTHNKEYPEEEYSAIRRVLTNSNMTKAKSNLEIEEFYNSSNIKEVLDHGTLNTIYYFCPFGNNGLNTIVPQQIRIKEESKDGEYTEDYEVQKYCGWSFVGCEDSNISKQMEIRNAYLTKLRNSNSTLTIRLANPNFALQRGTLVMIIRMRYDLKYKMQLMHQETNLRPGGGLSYEPDKSNIGVDNIWNEDILHNDSIGVISAEDSGMYYIDGMRFDYINGNDKIQQYLYLIRRDSLTSLNNLSTSNRLKFPQD